MTIKINVYLNNENDAEKLAATLRKHNIIGEQIEEIPQDADSEGSIGPAAGIGGAGSASQQGNPGVFASFKKLKEEMQKAEKKYPEYMLSFRIKEADKEAVLKDIKETDGYIDREVWEK